jgi:sugar (pentulose or hexulose) kinase
VVLDRSVFVPLGWLHGVEELFAEKSIVVAPAEGDQPTALAASLIGRPGMISCSFGTSVVANMVGKTAATTGKRASLPSVDKFNAVNGQPISMVWLRNGTTYLNRMVDSYGGDFERLLRQAVEAPPDCGGLLALPFLDDEPGLNVTRGGTGMIVGFGNSGGERNHGAGNVIKASMLSVMFNLYLGTQQVEAAEAAAATATIDDETFDDASGSANQEIVLTGGLTKTPETGQILADVFDRPVRLPEASDEGGAWGAALLAKYGHDCCVARRGNSPPPERWLEFLATIRAKEQRAFFPQPETVRVYRSMLAKYKLLLELQPQLDRVVNGD